ncbi:MAG: hypothetical protein AB7P33_13180 [Dehalococcoidia bacterium]
MNQTNLRSQVRVHPFTGLVVDVDTWATAHDYHRRHQELHLLTLHGSGIAYGLEVLPTDPPSDTVVIEPGVAVDTVGNLIVVPERQHVAISARSGTAYIAVDYVESIPPSSNGQKDTRARILEDFRLRSMNSEPEVSALELARIRLDGKTGPIIGAPNPWVPGAGEIDARFRPRLQTRAPRDLSVAWITHEPGGMAPSHELGLHFLLRELEQAGLRGRVTQTSDGSIPSGAQLLYVSGNSETAMPDALVDRLAEQHEAGAWLFVDACGRGSEMVQSVLKKLPGKGNAPTSEQFVLGAHSVFGAAPEGAFATKEIVWGKNLLISPRDYGCAWSGRRGDQVFQREVVRSALEFGVNVALSALQAIDAR